MEKTKLKAIKRERIKRRIRAKISGNAERPRMSVFKSGKHIYVSLVNDQEGKTLMGLSSHSSGLRENMSGKRGLEKAELLGKAIAEKAKASGIETVVFDRNGFKYHGRIKAVADAARSGGLNF